MHIKAFRLVTPAEAFSPAQAPPGGLRHPSAPAPLAFVVACESAELAAMLSDDLLWNQRRHAVLLRETLWLPDQTGLHEMALPQEGLSMDAGQVVPPAVADRIARGSLLSLWLRSVHAPAQHRVVINTAHPASACIRVTRRQIVLTRSAIHFQPGAEETADLGEAEAVA